MIKKYNIIGDLHGKDPEKYFDKECINIFLGDYFDPYDNTSFEEMQDNFLKLMDFKKEYPETILLYGNHDFHYIVPGEKYSRYSAWQSSRIKELFDEFEDYFHGIVYTIEDKYICSHAGITKSWLDVRIPGCKIDADMVEIAVNSLWSCKNDRLKNFGFNNNTNEYSDFYGTSPTHSPLWVRAQTLFDLNSQFPNIIQIVGHTQFEKIVNIGHTIFIDNLNYSGETLKIEI